MRVVLGAAVLAAFAGVASFVEAATVRFEFEGNSTSGGFTANGFFEFDDQDLVQSGGTPPLITFTLSAANLTDFGFQSTDGQPTLGLSDVNLGATLDFLRATPTDPLVFQASPVSIVQQTIGVQTDFLFLAGGVASRSTTITAPLSVTSSTFEGEWVEAEPAPQIPVPAAAPLLLGALGLLHLAARRKRRA